ncbi:MAG: hypothetical protein DLM53_06380 [Candidatus Eremiobacter antarcticus]|nr:response regulator transcription factor [Candidatus Eremiobacteraeota bacterium]MBC5807134.1 response regulator transcription factor [Candidatus Eremiobacteraeota bacterium]PZR62439.1 MAG: hypothetical protein DLM53_06380 [Candidatus Eremiobacter sp. RRmetagenome_bin22]
MVLHVAGGSPIDAAQLSDALQAQAETRPDVLVFVYLQQKRQRDNRSEPVGEIVRRIQRELRAPTPAPDILAVADLTIDRNRHEVTRSGRQIHLAPMEYLLLERLLVERDRVHSEASLVESFFSNAQRRRPFNSLWVHMHRLRRKIDGEGLPRLLHTIRGVGYILKTPSA